ncbi:MAG TPA: hypothetical protein VJ461_00125 [Candidatus Nanoarchaeia archaeon]|nr:hypothetical protein [Candidatus Nanoarchaeia archaeon]
MSLTGDFAKMMGSLFGKEIEKTFLEYYDDNHPEELLRASKEMMTKLLGPVATEKHCREMVKKHPEIKKMVEVLI